MAATTLPPGEFMKTTPRNPGWFDAPRANSAKVAGVSGSMTPSATITWGHRDPQSGPAIRWMENRMGFWGADAKQTVIEASSERQMAPKHFVAL